MDQWKSVNASHPSPRYLSKEGIDYILDHIPQARAADKESARVVHKNIRALLERQLQLIMLVPTRENIQRIINDISTAYRSSVIDSGIPVGSEASDALVAGMTQLTLDTHRSAGEMLQIGSGIGRVKNIINAVKKRKETSCIVHFKIPVNKRDVIDMIPIIVDAKVSDFVASEEILEYSQDVREWWHDFFDKHSGRKVPDVKYFMRIKTDLLAMYKHRVTPEMIATAIENTKTPIYTVVYSPLKVGIIDIFPDEKKALSYIEKKVEGAQHDNTVRAFLTSITRAKLSEMKVKGISDISDITPIEKSILFLIKSSMRVTPSEMAVYGLADLMEMYRIADEDVWSKGLWRIEIDKAVERAFGMKLSNLLLLLNLSHVHLLAFLRHGELRETVTFTITFPTTMIQPIFNLVSRVEGSVSYFEKSDFKKTVQVEVTGPRDTMTQIVGEIRDSYDFTTENTSQGRSRTPAIKVIASVPLVDVYMFTNHVKSIGGAVSFSSGHEIPDESLSVNVSVPTTKMKEFMDYVDELDEVDLAFSERDSSNITSIYVFVNSSEHKTPDEQLGSFIKRNSEDEAIRMLASYTYAMTSGSNLPDLFKLPWVDTDKTTTDNVHTMTEIFGVESSRMYSIYDMVNIMDDFQIRIDHRHITLAIDFIFSKGVPMGITYAGISRHRPGPISLITFERSMFGFTNAAIFGKEESIDTISVSTITGQAPPIGNNAFTLYPTQEDVDRLKTEYEEKKRKKELEALSESAVDRVVNEKYSIEGEEDQVMKSLNEKADKNARFLFDSDDASMMGTMYELEDVEEIPTVVQPSILFPTSLIDSAIVASQERGGVEIALPDNTGEGSYTGVGSTVVSNALSSSISSLTPALIPFSLQREPLVTIKTDPPAVDAVVKMDFRTPSPPKPVASQLEGIQSSSIQRRRQRIQPPQSSSPSPSSPLANLPAPVRRRSQAPKQQPEKGSVIVTGGKVVTLKTFS